MKTYTPANLVACIAFLKDLAKHADNFVDTLGWKHVDRATKNVLALWLSALTDDRTLTAACARSLSKTLEANDIPLKELTPDLLYDALAPFCDGM